MNYTICASLNTPNANGVPQPGANPDMQFNCVIVSEGTMVIDKGNVILSLGFLTPETIASAPIDLSQSYIYNHSVLGGSFFSKLKDFAQGAFNVGKKVVGAIRGVLDSGVLQKLPLPEKYKSIIAKADNLNQMAREHGYGSTGGRSIKKGILKKRAMGYGHIEDNRIEQPEDDEEPYSLQDEELLAQICEKKIQGKKLSKDDDTVVNYLLAKRETCKNANGGYDFSFDE